MIELKIGDKIEYDEGYDAENLKTSTIDSGFIMKNLEWRVLGVNEQGQLELISTQPTDSTLELTGKEGWIQAEEKLDTLCDELYGKEKGEREQKVLEV